MGRLQNLKEAALQEYLAREEARRAVIVSLIADVADTWLRVRELDERIILAHRTVDSRAESFHIFTRRYEEGSTSHLDLMQVEVLFREAQALLTELEQERAFQAHKLTLLVGTPKALPFAEEPFNDEGILQELRVGLPSELLIRHAWDLWIPQYAAYSGQVCSRPWPPETPLVKGLRGPEEFCPPCG